MKKIRNRNIKKSQKLKTPKTASLPISVPAISKSVRWPNVFYWAALILLTGFAIGLRIYKSHIAGISFDEAYTFIYYACDLEKALGSFSRINNHVFNSFLIYFAYKWFGNYEHFMRLPALVAGIWYILASIVLVHLTIQRKWLRFSVLGLLFFSVKVFEYTYLARGYSFMFAAITTQLVLVAYWSKHPIKASYWWLVVLLMSVMNFISFSSMLSAAFPLVAVNVTFIFLFSTHIYSPVPKYWKRVAIHLSGIFLLSTAFIALLFKNLLTAKGLFRVTRYNPKVTGINIPSYLHKMLVEEVFRPDDLLGNLLLWGVSALLVISVVWFARRVYLSVRQKQFKSLFFSNPAISYVTVVVLASFFMLFVFNIVLNKKLVHTRYHLYLLPLTTILFVIMLDSLISAIKSPRLSKCLCILGAILLMAIPLHNFPSSQYVLNSRMSMSRPVLQSLNKIHPKYQWRIAFSENLYQNHLGFWYYLRINKYNWYFVRDKEMIKKKQYDLLICSTDERPGITDKKTLYFLQDYLTPVKTAAIWNGPVPPSSITSDVGLWEGDKTPE